MRGAGLSVRDTLPLVSLEKILARGISTLIGSLLLLVFLVALGLAIFYGAGAAGQAKWSRSQTAAAAVAIGVLVLAVLAFSSPVLMTALLLSLGLGVLGVRGLAGVPRIWIWVGQYALVLGGLIASAYVYPQPLPGAEVEVEGGAGPVVGDLVTTTDFSWYVAGFDDDVVRAIPAADIENAEFESRERDDPPQVGELVVDIFD